MGLEDQPLLLAERCSVRSRRDAERTAHRPGHASRGRGQITLDTLAGRAEEAKAAPSEETSTTVRLSSSGKRQRPTQREAALAFGAQGAAT